MSDSKIRIAFDTGATKGIIATSEAAKRAERDVKAYTKAVKDSMKTGKGASAQQTAALNESLKRAEAIKAQLAQAKQSERSGSTGSQDSEDRKIERMSEKFSRLFGDRTLQKLMNGEQISAADVLQTALSSERLAASMAKVFGADPAFVRKVSNSVGTLVEGIKTGYRFYEYGNDQREFEDEFKLQMEKRKLGPQQVEMYNKAKVKFAQLFGAATGENLAKQSIDNNQKLASMIEGLSGNDIERIFAERNSVISKRLGSKAESLGVGVANAMAGVLGIKLQNKDVSALTFRDRDGKPISGEQIKQRIENAIRQEEQNQHATLSDEQRKYVSAETMTGISASEDVIKEFIKGKHHLELEKIEILSPSELFRKNLQEKIWRAAIDDLGKRVPANPTD